MQKTFYSSISIKLLHNIAIDASLENQVKCLLHKNTKKIHISKPCYRTFNTDVCTINNRVPTRFYDHTGLPPYLKHTAKETQTPQFGTINNNAIGDHKGECEIRCTHFEDGKEVLLQPLTINRPNRTVKPKGKMGI